jgi:hypothetical protein
MGLRHCCSLRMCSRVSCDGTRMPAHASFLPFYASIFVMTSRCSGMHASDALQCKMKICFDPAVDSILKPTHEGCHGIGKDFSLDMLKK